MNQTVYIANSTGTVLVWTFSDPLGPQIQSLYQGVGPIADFTIVGSRMYVGHGNLGLAVIDMSAAGPTHVGALALPRPKNPSEFFISRNVAVSGTRAVIFSSITVDQPFHTTYKLQIADIANPALPMLHGVYTDTRQIRAFDLAGDTLAVATDQELRLFDIHNPDQLLPQGAIVVSTTATIMALRVAGGYAYATDTARLLHIYDITNLAAPVERGQLQLADPPSTLAMSGTTLYGFGAAIVAIDVRSPAAPTLIKSTALVQGATHHVHIVGTIAFIAAFPGLLIYDLSDSTLPVLLGTYDRGQETRAVQVAAGNAYIIADSGLVEIVDVHRPARPTFLGYVYAGTGPIDLASDGARLYALEQSGTLYVFDTNAVAAPTNIGGYTALGGIYSQQVIGDRIYVAADAGVIIIDASDPAHLRMRSVISDSVQVVKVVGAWLYLIDRTNNLIIYDVHDPDDPGLVSSIALYRNQGSFVDVAAPFVALGDVDGTLSLYDMSDPPHPRKRGEYQLVKESISGVMLRNAFVYVRVGSGDFQVLDISNPDAIRPRGRFVGPDLADRGGMSLAGNLAYLASDAAGLEIIDVSNPDAPVLRTTYDTLRAFDVQVVGNRAYVADSFNGLVVLDASDPLNLVPLHQFSIAGQGLGSISVDAANNRIVVADGLLGMRLFRYDQPAQAEILAGGGSLTVSSLGLDVRFVNATFPAATIIHAASCATGWQPTPGTLMAIGHCYEISATDAATNEQRAPANAYTVRVQLTADEQQQVVVGKLASALHTWNNGVWTRDPSSRYNLASGIINAMPTHFSRWAILAPSATSAYRVYTPLVQR